MASKFIPKKSVNKALSEMRSTSAFKAARAANSRAVKEGIESVQKEMASTAVPIKNVIDKNLVTEISRKPNGRIATPAAQSAEVFNYKHNKSVIATNTEIADQKLANEIADARAAHQAKAERLKDKRIVNSQNVQGSGNKAQRRVEAIESNRQKLANEIADAREVHQAKNITNAEKRNKALEQRRMRQEAAQAFSDIDRGAGNKAQRRIDEINLRKRLDKTEDLDEFIKIEDQLSALNNKEKTFQERKAERIQKNAQEQAIAMERRNERKIAEEIGNNQSTRKNVAAPQQPETSPGNSGNDSAAKHLADRMKGNNVVYNMAALGVGGGLVLNMASNKGQQSNAQLYGQY